MGRKFDEEPTTRDTEILESIRWGHSQSDIAKVYGISKQRVYQIKNRWPHLCVRGVPPLTKGVSK